MQHNIAVIYLLFTSLVFCSLVVKPELLGIIILRRYIVRPASLFSTIRISAALFCFSSLLTLVIEVSKNVDK
jgi:hypothetical protein